MLSASCFSLFCVNGNGWHSHIHIHIHLLSISMDTGFTFKALSLQMDFHWCLWKTHLWKCQFFPVHIKVVSDLSGITCHFLALVSKPQKRFRRTGEGCRFLITPLFTNALFSSSSGAAVLTWWQIIRNSIQLRKKTHVNVSESSRKGSKRI